MTNKSLKSPTASRKRFVQQVLVSLPRRKPAPFFDDESRTPSLSIDFPSTDLSPNYVASGTSQCDAPSTYVPKATQAKTRRIPRSQLRALYRTLSAAELDVRTRLAVDRFRETVMEYIYATHKPDLPLPTTMQMRMYPPIARAAQDLDDVDYAYKLTLQAELEATNPGSPYLEEKSEPAPRRSTRSSTREMSVTYVGAASQSSAKRGVGRSRKNQTKTTK